MLSLCGASSRGLPHEHACVCVCPALRRRLLLIGGPLVSGDCRGRDPKREPPLVRQC